MSTAFELVRSTIADLGVPEHEVTPNADLRNDLDIDSTEIVELVASINAKLGTRLDGSLLKGVRSVDGLTLIVERASEMVHDGR